MARYLGTRIKEPLRSDTLAAIELAATTASPVFQLMGWTWKDQDRPPVHREIRDCLVGLCESAYGEDGSTASQSSTGRFTVMYSDGGFSISLELSGTPEQEE